MPVSDFFSAKIKSTFTEHTTTFTEYTKNKLSYEYVKITQLRMKCEGCNRDIYWASGGGEWKKKVVMTLSYIFLENSICYSN